MKSSEIDPDKKIYKENELNYCECVSEDKIEDVTLFQCNKCHDTFMYQRQYLSHHCIPKTGYDCPHCGHLVPNLAKLGLHLKKDHRLNRFKCDKCLEVFCSLSDLVDHLQEKHVRVFVDFVKNGFKKQ